MQCIRAPKLACPHSRASSLLAAWRGYFFFADFAPGFRSGVSSGITNPIGRFFGFGGAMSSRID